MLRSKKANREKHERLVAEWNAKYLVGQPVIVTKDDGDEIVTKTLHEATLLGGHTAVCWFEGITGAYLLERARVI